MKTQDKNELIASEDDVPRERNIIKRIFNYIKKKCPRICKIRLERVSSEKILEKTENGNIIRLYGIDKVKYGYALNKNNVYFSLFDFKKYYEIMKTPEGATILGEKKHGRYKFLLKTKETVNIHINEKIEVPLIEKKNKIKKIV